MRPFTLPFVCALVGCSYPEFGFESETDATPPGVDSGNDSGTIDAADTEPSDTTEPADATDACACSESEQCVASVCRPYASCAALHKAATSLGNGVYALDPDGAGPLAPFSAYCEMIEDGGGWTLALKLDGAQKTFAYDSALWTNDLALNPTSPALDTIEAKLASFSTMPFTSLRLGMLQGTRRYIHLDVTGTSLRAIFASSVTTTLGRAEWMKLLADPRLQPGCGAEGFNRDFTSLTPYAARARLGVLGNNESDCASPDSWIAFGAGFAMPHACVGVEPGIVVGNYNPLSCGNTLGLERATAAFGYILLR